MATRNSEPARQCALRIVRKYYYEIKMTADQAQRLADAIEYELTHYAGR